MTPGTVNVWVVEVAAPGGSNRSDRIPWRRVGPLFQTKEEAEAAAESLAWGMVEAGLETRVREAWRGSV